MTREWKIIRLCILSISLILLGRWRVAGMFYYPDHVSHDTPANHGLKFEPVSFPSRDGVRLSGWFMPAVGRSRGTVIHFHGNAQNMSSHFAFVSWLPAEGFNVFVFDYRGYGASEGRPSRAGLYRDSWAAIDYVRSREDVDGKRLLVFGQSLGGAQAIGAVGGGNRRGIRAVVIESTFLSYRSIVKDTITTMPFLSRIAHPLSFILSGNSYSPADYVKAIAPVPLLLIHGTADQVIPYHHGAQLLERAGDPKTFWRVEGATHLDVFNAPNSPYRRRLVDFFEQALR